MQQLKRIVCWKEMYVDNQMGRPNEVEEVGTEIGERKIDYRHLREWKVLEMN